MFNYCIKLQKVFVTCSMCYSHIILCICIHDIVMLYIDVSMKNTCAGECLGRADTEAGKG